MAYDYDAVIVGSGPNGLAAAITLARAGASVMVIEAGETIGGGMRTLEVTLPGFRHDICSAVHPLGIASPFFRAVPLADYGLEWIQPDAPLAHPFVNQPTQFVERSVGMTAAALGIDAEAYRALFDPLVANYEALMDQFLGPLRVPRHPVLALRFGLPAVLPATTLGRLLFRTPQAQALLAGMAAHISLPLEWTPTAGIGLVLQLLAHAVGWPVARGGSQAIADAMMAYLRTFGAQLITGWRVQQFDELPSARVYLFDTSPRELLTILGERLPGGYRHQLERFRYGQGIFKIDYALDAPIPWRDPATARAATVHLGGTLDEIAYSERAAWRGEHPERPYILLVQATLCDPSRAPDGRHTVWAYCHVPRNSTVDMTSRIDAEIERHAPGFRERILARSTRNAVEMERYNPNYIGGDINAGAQVLTQVFTRPAIRLNPYSTPLPNVFLCSSSTPPGGGVHGMSGYHAARSALRRL